MPLKYDHLLGREFSMERQNCYSLVRDFYRDNFGVELPDYVCPTDWWNRGLDLYIQLAAQNDFDIIHDHPRDWRPGDLVIMALNSTVGNHVAIVLDNGNILHHLVGQRSVVTSYGGMYRNNTVAVLRYRHLPETSTVQTVHFKDLNLPPHVRRRLEQIEARNRAAEEAEAGS